MKAKELLERYNDLKVAEVVRYDADVYCDVASIPRWDVPEKIVVATALTGSFVDKRQNPDQPFTPEEVVAQAEECIEAGATYLHFHTRDAEGRNIGGVETYKRIVDPLRARHGDKVVIDGCPFFGDNFVDANLPLAEGLFEVGIVNPVCTYVGDNVRWIVPEAARAQAKYFRALGIQTMVSIHDTASIDNANRFLIRPGLLEKPYFFIILADLPGLGFIPHPRALVEHLTLLVNRLKELDPDCQIMLTNCGRASIYMITQAILMGLHVRVGMEDSIWRYPHRDEKIASNLQVFEQTKTICELLGREVASAAETRDILNIPSEAPAFAQPSQRSGGGTSND